MTSRRWSVTDGVVVALALGAGLAIGWVDSRPSWDDTGITVGAIVLAAGGLALVRPRAWWAVALAVGLPVPALDLALRGGSGSLVAVAIAFAAAALGMAAGRAGRALADG